MSNLYNLLKTIIEKLNATKDAVNSLPQPDWNQNDETAHDHVKNRPFYTSDPVETVLVEESTVTFADTGYGFYAAEFPSTFEATVGETYKVYWDGTAYECTCVKFNNKPAIGNLSIAGAGSDTGEPFIIGIFNGERIQIIIADTSSSHTISISGFAQEVVKIDEKYLPDTLLSFKPAGKSYLTFSSLNSFTLAVNDATKHWDGTLEYFNSDKTWTTWDGTSALSAVSDDGKYVLYLRGTGNTVITGYSEDIPYSWVLTGTDISSVGNIENLLDYTTVTSGGHPTMANSCYCDMFRDCTSLTQAPALPATTLANSCYENMFYGCTSLTHAPALPATTLAIYCYENMFYGCTSLTQAPALPATTLIDYCYENMFYGCTSLTQAPALPATTLADTCYSSMFQDCTSLTQAPALPATTLIDYCYENMFYGCTSLTQAPALPATTLANSCYRRMFRDCTSLTQAPALPATTLDDSCYRRMFYGCTSITQAPTLPATMLASYCYEKMFYGCTSLTQAPALPATTLVDSCYSGMFQDCTSLTHAPALPATTLAIYCYENMFYGCTSLKLSSTQTGEYIQEYRVYYLKYGTVPTNAFNDMFTSTGGTFTGTPTFTTTYYLSSDNMIARGTEIATLNGYVGSMIDVAGEAEAPDWNELDSTSHSYIKNKPFERSLVATFISKHSSQGAAVLGDPQDTPRLEIGKTYYVYVDGSLSFSAECVAGGLWNDTGADHRVLKAPIDDGSSGNRNAICERISDNTLYAVTRSYDEMWKTGLPVEIYKVEKIHPDVLPIQPVDSTLTQSGQAADAAEVGNRLSALSEEIASVAGEAEALESLSECGIIVPAHQNGMFYTDASGAIYVL